MTFEILVKIRTLMLSIKEFLARKDNCTLINILFNETNTKIPISFFFFHPFFLILFYNLYVWL